MIPLNKPFLPPQEKVDALLKQVWRSGVVTNNGPLVQELEAKLKNFLGVKHVFLVSSGMAGLQLAVRAWERKGKILTSAFSYVAAASAIDWGGCEPVFTDCLPDTLCMDPIETAAKVDADTVAIFPTHLFGHSCDIHAFQNIASVHSIPLIFDAAHSFGSSYSGKPVASFGDISVLSFHAYKIFHTIEGGAVVTQNDAIAEKIYALRYFGQDAEGNFRYAGSNAKLSEVHAAVGLCNLDYFSEVQSARIRTAGLYESLLRNSGITFPQYPAESVSNKAYVAVLFPDEAALLRARNLMDAKNIQSRRYFYPAVHQTEAFSKFGLNFPNAESAAARVLCLPCFFDIRDEEVEAVAKTVLSAL